ncbi:MAG: endo alpha-1,4 polygalactosaminidase [Bacteroidetes bacterium]|nr:endo alpha-1,4 polygalactosaminidase [Bacteroidota bacterium]
MTISCTPIAATTCHIRMEITIKILYLTALVTAFFFFPPIGGGCQSLTNISNWAYQLQNISVPQIAADGSVQLMVIDYSLDGTDEFKFTPAEIAQMKSNGKLVIAYISIGEAEDYRFYWDTSWYSTPPSWLGSENPDWAGNYKVHFWEPQWQNIIFGYIDTIISQGFDGIYMDIIDAYYYWQVENPVEPLADSLMIQFILNIRAYVDSAQIWVEPFHLIPQNGEDIISSGNVFSSLKSSWFNAISAIGVEDVLYPGPLDEDNSYNPDSWRISQLSEYLAAGKPVFSIEYLTQPAAISQYVAAANSLQYIPYACVRALDQFCQPLVTSPDILSENLCDIKTISNPGNREIIIYSPCSITNNRIEIMDITSRIVYASDLKQQVETLHTGFLISGNYLLRIFGNPNSSPQVIHQIIYSY